MKVNDGGPAFPRSAFFDADCNERDEGAKGLSLRDWFAGQALAGWLASFGDEHRHPADNGRQNKQGGCPYTASQAYKLADAMLAERAKETP